VLAAEHIISFPLFPRDYCDIYIRANIGLEADRFSIDLIVLLLFVMSQNLAEEEPEKYQSHFSAYIKKGVEADEIEALYKKVHAAIRADPSIVKSTKQPPKEHKRYSSYVLYIVWST
jgi:hypothetical protein